MPNVEPAVEAGPAIDGRDLVVRRGGQPVLDHLTFGIAAGQVTGLLGPSGSGKTTLMRVLVGVQAVTAGTVTVLGLPAGHPRLRARIGYSAQVPAVYTDLTLEENLRYFGTVLGLRGRPLAQAIGAAVTRLGLAGLGQRLAGTFSGGQLTRAGLAVALLARPRLLILDEPTVGLDPVLRRDLWSLFHQLAADGAAVLVSTHVMDEAARCDTLLVMRQGRFLAEAAPGGLLHRTGTSGLESAFLALAAPQARAVPR